MRLAHLRCVLFGHCWFNYTYFGKPMTTLQYLANGRTARVCERCRLMELE